MTSACNVSARIAWRLRMDPELQPSRRCGTDKASLTACVSCERMKGYQKKHVRHNLTKNTALTQQIAVNVRGAISVDDIEAVGDVKTLVDSPVAKEKAKNASSLHKKARDDRNIPLMQNRSVSAYIIVQAALHSSSALLFRCSSQIRFPKQ